jgi:hypothetical protein
VDCGIYWTSFLVLRLAFLALEAVAIALFGLWARGCRALRAGRLRSLDRPRQRNHHDRLWPLLALARRLRPE